MNYEVHQGQENTYFKFQLVDEEVNTYVGTFGFKDEGDVDASYITKFISFLQDAFHYPLQVKHFVMANGGSFANGGGVSDYMNSPQYKASKEKMDKSHAQLKSRVVRVVGIDDAMEFFDYKHSSIAPYKFLERAVSSNLIELDEINEELVESALEKTRELDDDDIEEIGSSDFTYYLKSVLDEAGFKVGFVNSKLRRLNEDGSVKEISNNFANGGMFDNNEGFMRADNENNYRYPETEVYVETIDEPIDLRSDIGSKTNNVFIKSINDDIDLNEGSKIRARMGYNPIGRTPEKMMAVNQRMVVTDLPKPISTTHKND